jgi:hypothetical protein
LALFDFPEGLSFIKFGEKNPGAYAGLRRPARLFFSSVLFRGLVIQRSLALHEK